MSDINIKACKYCANKDALLAVVQWINENARGSYKRIRNVKIENGKEFNVFEKLRNDELISCNADFIVTCRKTKE